LCRPKPSHGRIHPGTPSGSSRPALDADGVLQTSPCNKIVAETLGRGVARFDAASARPRSVVMAIELPALVADDVPWSHADLCCEATKQPPYVEGFGLLGETQKIPARGVSSDRRGMPPTMKKATLVRSKTETRPRAHWGSMDTFRWSGDVRWGWWTLSWWFFELRCSLVHDWLSKTWPFASSWQHTEAVSKTAAPVCRDLR